jgi:uncharacterized alkaline shock family protein YloU
MVCYYETEKGRVYLSPDIVRSHIAPEIAKAKCFRPLGYVITDSPLEQDPRELERGIQVESEEGKVIAKVHVEAQYGVSINKEAEKLSANIRRALKLSTGLEVADLVVNIDGVFAPQEQSSRGKSRRKKG